MQKNRTYKGAWSDTTNALGARRRGDLRAAGLLGKPIQRAWIAKNARAVASKAACRNNRRTTCD